MVIYIQDVLARRQAAALLATIRMAAAGGTRGRTQAAGPRTGRAALMATLIAPTLPLHTAAAADLPTLYAEATLV